MRRRLRSNNTNLINLAMLGVMAMASGFLLTSFLGSKSETQAFSATEFQAGRIIDDSIFYNPNTMTAAEIDAFIDSHSPACDMWGTQKVYGNVTRAEYVKQLRAQGYTKYHDPPFVCVSEYYENPETHKTNFETGGKKEEGMLSAGEIIYQAAHEYNVNPQVLLVMLKKESYVWGDDWPHSFQYNTVMGYACPDGAPCDTKYFGFYNQVMMAAWQLNYYREHIYSYNYRPYATNNILYNPDRSCGSKPVYLENIATTSLYIYTPYVPNDGALANYPGTSWCGSYGNRNFYMYFREWFGSTLNNISHEPLATPRAFLVKNNTKYYDYFTLAEKGTETEDFVAQMNMKTNFSNNLYVATTAGGRLYNYSDIEEYTSEIIQMGTPRYMVIPENVTPVNRVGVKLSKNTTRTKQHFTNKKYIRGLLYLVSESDDNVLYLVSDLEELSNTVFVPLGNPRIFITTEATPVIDPETNIQIDNLAEGITIRATDKTTINGTLCLRDSSSDATGASGCIMLDDLIDTLATAGDEYVSLGRPRAMRIKTQSSSIQTSGKLSPILSLNAGDLVYFSKKTYFGDNMCLVSDHDYKNGQYRCIPFENLEETDINIVPMGNPRSLKTTPITKIMPLSASGAAMSVPSGETLFFSEKMETSEGLCLRGHDSSGAPQNYCYYLYTLLDEQ